MVNVLMDIAGRGEVSEEAALGIFMMRRIKMHGNLRSSFLAESQV